MMGHLLSHFKAIGSLAVGLSLLTGLVLVVSWKRLQLIERSKSLVGFFDPEYLQRGDVAVVKKNNHIVAFANIWVTHSKQELAVDLMRFSSLAPAGCMEYLLVQLMIAAKDKGYERFSLGMAPLAGLESFPNSRRWNKVGTMIYRAGDLFFNFRGLRSFKEKFSPEWESRFLVYAPSVNLALVLSSLARLIGRRVIVERAKTGPEKQSENMEKNVS